MEMEVRALATKVDSMQGLVSTQLEGVVVSALELGVVVSSMAAAVQMATVMDGVVVMDMVMADRRHIVVVRSRIGASVAVLVKGASVVGTGELSLVVCRGQLWLLGKLQLARTRL